MADLLSDLGALEGEFEEAGSAASGFRAMLDSLPGAAIKAATGFDSSTGRFRAASGQFQAASSLASGAFQGAMSKIGSGGKAAAGAIQDLGATVKALASDDLPSAGQAMAAIGATLGSVVTSGADAAAGALSKLGPEGAAAGVAIQGLAAVLSATIGLMATFMGMAIEASQTLGMMSDRFAALAGSAAAGKAVQAMLSHLNLPFATSEVNGWAQALLGAGVKGKQLEADVKAIAAATALMGENGGAAAQTLFKRLGEGGPAADSLLKTFKDGGPKADKLLKEMGLSIADLGGKAALAKMTTEQLHEAIAKAMQKKGQGPLADMALTLPAILQAAREGFMSLFTGAGPAVKAFMQAVKSLFGEFNKGSPIINTLKPIMTGLLATLFGWATKAVNAIHGLIASFSGAGKSTSFFSGAVSALKAGWGALVSIFGAVKAALSPMIAMLKAVFSNAMVINGIKTIFTVIAGVIVGVVVVVATLAAVFATVAAGIAAAVGAIVGSVMGIVGAIADAVGGAVDALGGLIDGAGTAASGFVDGLVGGIAAGASAVIGAVMGLASGAMSAFTGFFGIKSPSTKMLKHGEDNIAGAAATGVDKGADKMDDAMARMGSGEPGKGGGKSSKGQSGGRAPITFNNCVFGGDVTEGKVREWIGRFLDETALEAPQPEGT